MYFSNITNREVSKFHRKNNTNVAFPMYSEGDLFELDRVVGSVLKIIPMFYYEDMETVDRLVILDDGKCFICTEDAKIEFKSKINKTKSPIIRVDITQLSYSRDGIQEFTFYEKDTLKPVPNVECRFLATLQPEGEEIEIIKKSDEDGVCTFYEDLPGARNRVYHVIAQFSYEDFYFEIDFNYTLMYDLG